MISARTAGTPEAQKLAVRRSLVKFDAMPCGKLNQWRRAPGLYRAQKNTLPRIIRGWLVALLCPTLPTPPSLIVLDAEG